MMEDNNCSATGSPADANRPTCAGLPVHGNRDLHPVRLGCRVTIAARDARRHFHRATLNSEIEHQPGTIV